MHRIICEGVNMQDAFEKSVREMHRLFRCEKKTCASHNMQMLGTGEGSG